MKAADLDQTLATIAKQAPVLRAAGVSGRVRIGDLEFDISDLPTTITAGTGNEAASDLDPLDDPYTYGNKVPTRRGSPRELGDDDGSDG